MYTAGSTQFANAVMASMLLAAALCAPSAVQAASGGGQPLILDTQRGIIDGQSGTVLQNAPLSKEPIVQAAPTAQPQQLAPDSSMPIYVAPYIQYPANGGQPPSPNPGPRPGPRPVPQPRQ
ncbi:hypothetical protein GCM10027093_13200 [Paraburkholderia jirisanensis]